MARDFYFNTTEKGARFRVALCLLVAFYYIAHSPNAEAQMALGRLQQRDEQLILAQIDAEVDASPTPVPGPVNADGTAEAARVMVTGSYIPVAPTAAEVGPNPVQVLDRYTIEKSGERSIEQVLRNLPIANANGAPISGNAGALEQGSSSISLRGLDAGATLTLINGRRMVPQPSGIHGGYQFAVDLNTIPKAAIESVEILKDGASSTYGADAVAGVVNIKLRQDYRGSELNVEYGNTTTKDSGEKSASLVFGVGNEKTNLTGLLSYYSREAIFSRDRAYDRNVPALRTSFGSSPYNLEVSRAAAEAAAGRPITEVPLFDANGNRIDTFFAHAPLNTNGRAPASEYVYTLEPELTFPFTRFDGQFPETERYGSYLSANHKVFGEQLVAYADLFFQRADLLNELAPAETAPFNSSQIAIPPPTPGLTLGGPSYEESGLPPGAYNPFNPFPQIISGGSMGRVTDFGNRRFDSRNDAFFTTAGLRGDKLFNGTWGYDAGLRYSRVESTIYFGWPSLSRFRRVLNAADPIFDPASPDYIGTTVPFNPFGDYRVRIANNERLASFVNARAREFDIGTLLTADATIYTTSLFNLPAGGVGVALGGQFQRETNDQNPHDELGGDLLGGGGYVAIHGSRDVYAIYAESSLPIFGGTFTAPGFHSLELTAAVRYEAFLNNDSNVAVPKFGLRWQPLDDSLTLRATWGEGYKQAALTELFAPDLSGPAANVYDPVKGVVVPLVTIHFPPNPNLQPEDSRNFTAGIVYSPKFVPGLTVTVDLFNIETTGYVNPNPNPSDIIARIAAGNGLPGESVTRDANGNLLALTEVSFVNSGSKKARGADFGIVYQLQTSVGTFTSTTQATWLESFEFSPAPGHPEEQLRSRPVVSGFFSAFSEDAYLEWRGTSRFDWSWRGLGAAVTARYFDGFHEIDAAGNEHWVRQTWFFDLQASYAYPLKADTRFQNGWPTWRYLLEGTTLTVGCNNVFDHDPPRSNDNFPRFIYDPTGRFVYLSLTKKF